MLLLLAQAVGGWSLWGGSSSRWCLQRLKAAIGSNPKKKWGYAGAEPSTQLGSVADLDGDGSPELLFGSPDGRLLCLSAEAGELLWEFRTGGAIASPPTLLDLNGDGSLEVVFGSEDETFYCLDSRGNFLWYVRTLGPARASPVPFDADTDGLPEVALGSDDSTVIVVDEGGEVLWERKTWGSVRALASADLDFDGTEELVLSAGSHVVCLPARPSGPRWDVKLPGGVKFLILVDLNLDGKIEALAATDEPALYLLNWQGQALWNLELGGEPTGLAAGWVGGRLLGFASAGDELLSFDSSGGLVWQTSLDFEPSGGISLADLNGDGEPEILAAGDSTLAVFEASDGTELWRLELPGASAPFAADLDADGCSELVVNSEGLLTFDDPEGAEDCGLIGVKESPGRGLVLQQRGKFLYISSAKPTKMEVRLYGVDGRLEGWLFRGVLDGEAWFALPEGVHVVKAGGRAITVAR